MKPSIVLGALALCLVGCAGIQNPFTAPVGTRATVALSDLNAAIKALPAICNAFAVGAGLTNAEIAILQTTGKLPAKTVANISNASAQGLLLCNGTAAVIAPLAAQ